MDNDHTRRAINIDENPRNADWPKRHWDLPGVTDPATLHAHLRTIGITIEHFKTLPVYRLSLDKPGLEWLRDL